MFEIVVSPCQHSDSTGWANFHFGSRQVYANHYILSGQPIHSFDIYKSQTFMPRANTCNTSDFVFYFLSTDFSKVKLFRNLHTGVKVSIPQYRALLSVFSASVLDIHFVRKMNVYFCNYEEWTSEAELKFLYAVQAFILSLQ